MEALRNQSEVPMSLPQIRPAPESINLPKYLKHHGQSDHQTELAMRIGMPQTRVGLAPKPSRLQANGRPFVRRPE